MQIVLVCATGFACIFISCYSLFTLLPDRFVADSEGALLDLSSLASTSGNSITTDGASKQSGAQPKLTDLQKLAQQVLA